MGIMRHCSVLWLNYDKRSSVIFNFFLSVKVTDTMLLCVVFIYLILSVGQEGDTYLVLAFTFCI